jgi:hypothetical protein
MTIGSSSPARVSFNCDGSTKVFPVPIQAYQNTDLTVILTAPQSAGGAETTLVLNSDYSLAPSGTLQPTAWTLTTLAVAAYATGYTLQVFVNPVQQQQTQYVQGQAFPSLAVQTNIDRLTQMVQRLQDEVSRCIRVPDGDVSPVMLLPAANARIAAPGMVFDANGNLVLGTIPTTVMTQASIAALFQPQSAAEAAAGVTPASFIFSPGPPQDVRRYGAKFDNSTDDTAALVTSYLVAAQTLAGATGSGIALPTGISLLSAMLLLPNRARTLGVNKRGSYFQAKNTWAVGNGSAPWSSLTNYVTGNLVTQGGVLYIAKQASLNQTPPNATFWNPISNAMLYAQNGYTLGAGNSMFDSTLENVTVDANNVAGLGCVLSSAWQEDCGLRGVLLTNFATYGIRFQDGFGGASLSKIIDTEVFGGTAAITAALAVGVDLQQISSVGAFMLDVSDTSIVGLDNTHLLDKGINVVNDSLHCRNVHFEYCNRAIYVAGVGNIVLIGVTGSPTVTTLVEIDAGFTGTLTMLGCFRNGATNFVKDNRAGGVGTITGHDNPQFTISGSADNIRSLATAVAWCVFDGTVAGTNAPTAGFGVTNITRTGTGRYTVNLTRSMASANCSPQATSANPSLLTAAAVAGVSSVTVSINNTSLVATDNSEIHVVVFGS